MSDAAAPPLSEVHLERGRRLTALVRDIEAEVSSWMDEVTAATPALLEAQVRSNNALQALQAARVELGILTQVIAQAGP